VNERRFVEASAVPSNKAMELTSEIVTPYAYAKVAPIAAAAHRKR
jgi:hypothetical protein